MRPDSFSSVPRASGPVFMFCVPGLIFGDTEGFSSHFHVLRSRTRFRPYRRRMVPYSCFAPPDSFSAVPRASGPVFTFCALGLVFGGTGSSGPVFMLCAPRTVFVFCAPGLIFGGTKGVGSRFQVMRARTHFWRYRGRRVQLSCVALPDTFSAVPRASGPILMSCAPGLIFGRTDGVWSHIHVLRTRTRFWQYRVRRVPFSCFMCPDSFSAVPRASGPVFIFCVPGFVFGGIEGVGSRFHVLRSRTCFWRYRGCRVSFSCFSLRTRFQRYRGRPSCFHVLRSRTHFRRFRELRVPFSCLARPDSFSMVPRTLGPIFVFSAPGVIFNGPEGDGSRFHFFSLPDPFSVVPRVFGPVVMFCAPGLIFGGIGGVRSRFIILRARNHFWRYRGRRVPFSCLACPDPFSVVTRVFGPVFVF
jgi:hypothetical protein